LVCVIAGRLGGGRGEGAERERRSAGEQRRAPASSAPAAGRSIDHFGHIPSARLASRAPSAARLTRVNVCNNVSELPTVTPVNGSTGSCAVVGVTCVPVIVGAIPTLDLSPRGSRLPNTGATFEFALEVNNIWRHCTPQIVVLGVRVYLSRGCAASPLRADPYLSTSRRQFAFLGRPFGRESRSVGDIATRLSRNSRATKTGPVNSTIAP
jgi:hypothetical protein